MLDTTPARRTYLSIRCRRISKAKAPRIYAALASERSVRRRLSIRTHQIAGRRDVPREWETTLPRT